MAEDPLASLVAVDRADVYKGDDLAGHLTRTAPGVVEFSYEAEWVADARPAVASTLPVTARPVTTVGGAVPAYFAGLLPEGRRLTALRQAVKTSADDELTLLLGVGGDTVGDVRVVPGGHGLHPVTPRLTVEAFADVRFDDLLRGIGVRVDRVGLPGVQDKVSAAMLNLPVEAAGHGLLLKLDPPEFPHLVANEHFFLEAARRAGLDTVDARLVHDGAGVPGLAVTRFDRAGSAGGPYRLAVEDGCQALGIHPAEKYRVSTESVIARLCALSEAAIPAAATFLGQITFAFLTGNGDAHAKNFSVLQDPTGRWQPAPAYDVPSSQPYGDQTMALTVDGRRDGGLTGSRFVQLGSTLGLRQRAARRVVERVARSADRWFDDILDLPFDRARVVKLQRVVRNRQQMLLQ